MQPIEWHCESCRFPIDDFGGSVAAPYTEIADNLATWHPWHYQCQPTDGYQIDVSQLRTSTDVIRWTRHLRPKHWFDLGAWDAILAHAVESDERPTRAVI